MKTNGSGLKLCLAGSGGGHVRQLLDLEPVWRHYDHFFVTEDTALGRSLADSHPVHFVAHYAIGQARLGSPFKMLRGAIANLVQSWRIIRRERPDVVISTGAGAVFLAALFARLMGAKFIAIESFARFDRPSKFGRIAAIFATDKVVQAAALKSYWPDALLFDPLRMLEGERPAKEPLLFATVGATLAFERLTDTVLALKASGELPEKVILQIGADKRPLPEVSDLEVVESLSFEAVTEILNRAEFVVCHGGTGSLITALRAGCRVIAIPRRFDLGEHYDDHQEEISSVFAARGLIELARNPEDLGPAIARARAHQPVMATTDPSALIAWLNELLGGLAGNTLPAAYQSPRSPDPNSGISSTR